ncbi:uncharacterized protein LOC118599961 [Oryzias melastigma]|uniref:uncharacterized protein LOC118599961 n=1 Tax=Oryzias melastigma TaxID=30732 RepID=UPI00168CC5E7|nr:uncharacterized protein LOC118599961 [Oryzias melastigma]
MDRPVDQDQQRGQPASPGKKISKGKSCSPSCICCQVQPHTDPIITFGLDDDCEVVPAPASSNFVVVSDSSSSDSEEGVTFGSSDVELETSEVQVPVPAAGTLKFNSIRGSFHQGNELFGQNAGRQCMAISLVAAAKHTVKSVFLWDSSDLDSVLLAGDQVYSDLLRQNKITDSAGFLRVTDLPDQAVVDGVELSCEFGEVVSGDVNVNSGVLIDDGVLVPLKEGLVRMTAQYNTCLLTLCENTCAVIAENGRWALIDSHSRDADGMRTPDGTSIVRFFDSVGDIHDYLQRLVKGIQSTVFEIVGVIFSATEAFDPFLGSPAASSSLKLCKESLFSDTAIDNTQESKKTAAKRKIGVKSNLQGPSFEEGVKKAKLDDVAVEELDVIITSEPEQEIFYFNPLSRDVCQALCSILDIEFQNFNAPVSSPIGLLGPPCTNESIVGDGNCYFRAISQAVTRSQNSHRKIRLGVVKHMENNPDQYSWIIGREYSSVDDYINKSRMRFVSVWATELEIQATADLLGVNVFVLFNGRWLRHKCNGRELSSNGIYIQNCGGIHKKTTVLAVARLPT